MPTFDDFGDGSFESELDAGMWTAGPNLPDDEPMPEDLDDLSVEDDACPECGAPPGEECDPRCPMADEPEGVDPDTAWDTRGDKFESHNVEPSASSGNGAHPSDCECPTCEEAGRQNESFGFSKFMDRIISEETKKGMPVLNDSPHRKRALREQEHPMGRTRIGGK